MVPRSRNSKPSRLGGDALYSPGAEASAGVETWWASAESAFLFLPESVLFSIVLDGFGPLGPHAVRFEIEVRFPIESTASPDMSNGITVKFDALSELPILRVPSGWRKHRPRQALGILRVAAIATAAPATYTHACWARQLPCGRPAVGEVSQLALGSALLVPEKKSSPLFVGAQRQLLLMSQSVDLEQLPEQARFPPSGTAASLCSCVLASSIYFQGP